MRSLIIDSQRACGALSKLENIVLASNAASAPYMRSEEKFRNRAKVLEKAGTATVGFAAASVGPLFLALRDFTMAASAVAVEVVIILVFFGLFASEKRGAENMRERARLKLAMDISLHEEMCMPWKIEPEEFRSEGDENVDG